MVSTRRVEDYSKLLDLESATARTIALTLHTFCPPYVAPSEVMLPGVEGGIARFSHRDVILVGLERKVAGKDCGRRT